MIINEEIFKGEVDVKYFFQKSLTNSSDLIIIFSAFQAAGQGPKYNYINTLAGVDCNKLFILDDFGSRGSYYLCKEKDFKIERSVISLINKIKNDNNFQNITSCGSSKGGYASLYFGIKYGFNNIIAASPQFLLGMYLDKSKSPDVIKFLAGEVNDYEIKYLDTLLINEINNSKFKPNIFLHLGKGEYHYKEHVIPLIKTLELNKINYELDLGDYDSHSDVGKFFPKYLLHTISKVHKYPNIISIKPDNLPQQKLFNEITFLADLEGDHNKIAWYVYKDNKVIQKYPYSGKNTIKIKFNEIGLYKIKVFVKNSINYKTTKITKPFSVVNIDKVNSDISFKELNPNQIIKVYETSNNSEKIGNQILNNKFYFYGSLELVDFSKGIDWDYQHAKSPETYQLYMQSLNVICHLLNAYEKTNEKKYLDKSVEIFMSWYKYSKSNPNNKMLWYDHPTAYRTHNLIYFALILKDKLPISREEYISLLVKHADFMYADNNYRKNNHGIMMDRSLILVGLTLNHHLSTSWVEKGIWRLKDTFNHSYSKLGVHLENSPDYHSIVRTLYGTIEKFLNKNDLTLGLEINNRLTLSDEYFKYLVKPDGNLPTIGDTELKYYGISDKNYESFHDQTAGISILQSKDNNDPSKSTWISFISGFGTTTHKHFDDLSFNLQYMGEDIFVDSGKYNYGSSQIRGYVKSPRAHNILTVKGKKYKFINTNNDTNNVYTKSFYSSRKMDIVQGRNNGFDEVELKRSLILIKPDILILLDEVICDTTKKISQYFNLAPHIKITNKQKECIKITSKENIIEIEQVLPVNSLYVHKASLNPPQAIISNKFNKIIETNQLEYCNNISSKGNFLTVIKLGQDAINKFSKIEFNENKRLISIIINDDKLKFYI